MLSDSDLQDRSGDILRRLRMLIRSAEVYDKKG